VIGWLPYTYCHAHTRRPPACNSETRVGLNWDDQKLVPSLLFMITVPTPYWRAVATI
jgi:hypothetical protein